MLMRYEVIIFYLLFLAVMKSSSLAHIRNHFSGEHSKATFNTHDELSHYRQKRLPFKKLTADGNPNKYKENLWDPLGEADKGKDVVHVPCPKRKFNVLSKDVKANGRMVKNSSRDKVTRDLFKSRLAKGGAVHPNDLSQEQKHRQQWLIFSQERSPENVNYGVQETEQQSHYKSVGGSSNVMPNLGLQANGVESSRGAKEQQISNNINKQKLPKDKFGYNTQMKNLVGAAVNPRSNEQKNYLSPRPVQFNSEDAKYSPSPFSRSFEALTNSSWSLQQPGAFMNPVPVGPPNQNTFLQNSPAMPPTPKGFFPAGVNMASEFPMVHKLFVPNNTLMDITQGSQQPHPVSPPKGFGPLPGTDMRHGNAASNLGGFPNANSGNVGNTAGGNGVFPDGRYGPNNFPGSKQALNDVNPINGIADLKSNATKFSFTSPKTLTPMPTQVGKTSEAKKEAVTLSEPAGGSMQVFNIKKKEYGQAGNHQYNDPLTIKSQGDGSNEPSVKSAHRNEQENKIEERKEVMGNGQAGNGVMKASNSYNSNENIVNHVIRNEDHNQAYCCEAHVHNSTLCSADCQCKAGFNQGNVISEKSARGQENAPSQLKHVLDPPVAVETQMFTNGAHKIASKVPMSGDVTYRPFRAFAPARNDEIFYDKNMNFLGRIVHPPLVNIKRGKNVAQNSRHSANYHYKWYPRNYPTDYLNEPADFHSDMNDMRAKDFTAHRSGLRKARKCLKGHQSMWRHLRGDKSCVRRPKGTA